jgi:hypothetical protein
VGLPQSLDPTSGAISDKVLALSKDPRVRITNNIGLMMIDSVKNVQFNANSFTNNYFLTKAAVQLINTDNF